MHMHVHQPGNQEFSPPVQDRGPMRHGDCSKWSDRLNSVSHHDHGLARVWRSASHVKDSHIRNGERSLGRSTTCKNKCYGGNSAEDWWKDARKFQGWSL